MKLKSIKLSIMWNLLISLILAAFSTGILFFIFFCAMEIISRNVYVKFLKLCYSTTIATVITSLVMLVIYLVSAILIFTYRLNEITFSIKQISSNIHKLAEGNFTERLSVKSNHELGSLANDINRMSDKIDAYIKQEQRWNEERYHMITNMSHDLKTPIMSIAGYIDLIKNKKYADENECNAYCEIVSKKSEELSIAINQLFELSRLNSNALQLQKTPIKLNEFMEQVLISYIPLFDERSMSYRIRINPDIMMAMDPQLMKRVFDNIISNAIKYAGDGKYLEISADRKDNQVTIHFINNGPMIPHEDMEHIFERYYREKSNLAHEGNGLGLAIAKTIVQLHGGAIHVTSDAERTDFFIVMNV